MTPARVVSENALTFADVVGVGAVDGEVVDRGCGGVATEVDNPDFCRRWGCGVGRRGRGRRRHTSPASFPSTAMHGGPNETTVLIHPERMLHSRDERLYCIAFNYLCERAPQLPSR